MKPLRAPEGAAKKKHLVGRGRSSGSGKTCGRGHKGQKARSGGGVRSGFEGGQMPLYRRVAARGFSNHPFKTEYAVVNVAALEKCYSDGEEVSHSTLVQKGLVKNGEKCIKILGIGDLQTRLEVSIPALSASAREKIVKAGGSVISTENGKERSSADGK